jgi:hypothetical protein
MNVPTKWCYCSFEFMQFINFCSETISVTPTS